MFMKHFAKQKDPAPFIATVTHWPDEEITALCYPSASLGDYLYCLNDGTLARVDTCAGFRVNFGDGWQQYKRRAFSARINGRVISLHRKDARGVYEPCGSGWDV